MATYSSDCSIPTKSIPSSLQAIKVVPLPAKGSRQTPSLGVTNFTNSLIISRGLMVSRRVSIMLTHPITTPFKIPKQRHRYLTFSEFQFDSSFIFFTSLMAFDLIKRFEFCACSSNLSTSCIICGVAFISFFVCRCLT